MSVFKVGTVLVAGTIIVSGVYNWVRASFASPTSTTKDSVDVAMANLRTVIQLELKDCVPSAARKLGGCVEAWKTRARGDILASALCGLVSTGKCGKTIPDLYVFLSGMNIPCTLMERSYGRLRLIHRADASDVNPNLDYVLIMCDLLLKPRMDLDHRGIAQAELADSAHVPGPEDTFQKLMLADTIVAREDMLAYMEHFIDVNMPVYH